MGQLPRPVVAAFVAALALAGYALWVGHRSATVSGARVAPRPASAREHQAVNILLLGADGGDIHGNTDVIMLVRLDRERRTAWVLSVPRDSRVEIPGHGIHKINAANPIGGPDLTVTTVSRLVGATIDHWVLVDFKGAARIIDRLGGVTIDVPVDMHKDDPTQNLHIHLRKGRQHLNGEQAVNFARFRGLVMGDISRTQNQQLLIREMARQLMASATLDRLPGLIPELWRSVRTDIGLTDAVRLASWFRGARDWTVLTATLPGNFQWIGGVSYWGVDPAKARQAWADFLQGRPVALLDESLALGHPPVPRHSPDTVAGAAYEEGSRGGTPGTSGEEAGAGGEAAATGGEAAATGGEAAGANGEAAGAGGAASGAAAGDTGTAGGGTNGGTGGDSSGGANGAGSSGGGGSSSGGGSSGGATGGTGDSGTGGNSGGSGSSSGGSGSGNAGGLGGGSTANGSTGPGGAEQ